MTTMLTNQSFFPFGSCSSSQAFTRESLFFDKFTDIPATSSNPKTQLILVKWDYPVIIFITQNKHSEFVNIHEVKSILSIMFSNIIIYYPMKKNMHSYAKLEFVVEVLHFAYDLLYENYRKDPHTGRGFNACLLKYGIFAPMNRILLSTRALRRQENVVFVK